MTNPASPFAWQGPSQIAKKPKRKSRATPANAQQRTEKVLRMRYIGAYLKAQPSQEAS